MEEGALFKVKLEKGEGSIFKKPSSRELASEIALEPSKVLILPAPKEALNFGLEEASIHWVTQVQEIEKKVQFLWITPQDGAEIFDSQVSITGESSSSHAQLTINGKKIVLDKKNKFTTKMDLRLGANLVVFQLVKDNGESIFKKLTFYRQEK